MILGLDISTSITGVTVLNDKGEILHCEAIDTRNKNHFPTLFEKASKVRDYLGDIEYKYDIEHIYIEKAYRHSALAFRQPRRYQLSHPSTE